MRILVVNFNLAGVNEQQYEGLCDQIAPAFAAVPGTDFEVQEAPTRVTHGLAPALA